MISFASLYPSYHYRESGKPTACREHHFHHEQTGEALAQKLQAIAFTLAEEESLTLTDVTRRTRSGFDIERVTKRFYDQFKKDLASREACAFLVCLTNSSLFYWFYSTLSDCEHVNDALIRAFPIPNSWRAENWIAIEDLLTRSLTQHSTRKAISTSQGHSIEYDELNASQSKDVIDEIDRVLARHYGFTEEELDFIINYDIKYRMGRDADGEDE